MSQTCCNCFSGTNGVNPCPVCGYDNSLVVGRGQALPQGTILHDGFFVGRVLGQGGFGITYLGYELHSKRRIAIKEYFPSGVVVRDGAKVQPTSAENNAFFRRGLELFNKEAQILSRLSGQPNIVEVISFFFENNTGYFVMEFLEGNSLKDYLAIRGGRISFQEALKLLLPTMDALETVHHEGMLHRDIAPDNVFVTNDGVAKLIDFGAARFRREDETKSIRTIVKPGYAPMEQYTSQTAQGPWSDVYAMGATIYRAITGITPPDAPTRSMNDELQSPAQLGCQLPNNADYAIMRALSPRIVFRFASMGEFINALKKPDSAHEAENAQTKILNSRPTGDLSIFGGVERYRLRPADPAPVKIAPNQTVSLPLNSDSQWLGSMRVQYDQTGPELNGVESDSGGEDPKNNREDLLFLVVLFFCAILVFLILFGIFYHQADAVSRPLALSGIRSILTMLVPLA